MGDYTHIIHPFEPLYNSQSKILILGSLPSVKSREQGFFYGHPQNRYWKLMAALLKEAVPKTIEEKKSLILSHNIAMWDAVYSCDIIMSEDKTIKNAVTTDLLPIIQSSRITHIFCNGNTAGAYYARFQEKQLGIRAVTLPSTSPANAAWSFERLTKAWSVILPPLTGE